MRILLTHMSDDTNKGDFAILHALSDLLRRARHDLVIASAELELTAVRLQDDRTSLTRKLGFKVVGTPVPSLGTSFSGPFIWGIDLLLAETSLHLVRVLGVRAEKVLRPSRRGLLAELMRSDAVVAKGGSYLYSHGGFRNFLFLWRMTYALRLASAAGRRVILAGVSLGPYKGRCARYLASRVLGRVDHLIVRERRSLVVAQDLAVDPARVSVMPDVAFLHGLPKQAGVRPRAGSIGFTVRELPYRLDERPLAELQKAYEDALLAGMRLLLEETDLSLVMVTQVDQDLPLGLRLLSRLDTHRDRVRVVPPPETLSELLGCYVELDVLVGTRLHSTILAAAVGTPIVSLVCDPAKQIGTMEMLDLEAWALPCERLDGRGLATTVKHAVANRAALSSRLVAKVAAQRAAVEHLLLEALPR
jgi:polysaccharide pyruvyl transferase WcaK-like protein